MRRFAVIDIGTNSVKLLLADVQGRAVLPLHERSEQTRLGTGFYPAHRLQPEPLARTARAVADFATLARGLGASALRVIATSAARDAVNAPDLFRAVQEAAGLAVEVISGEQEAEWAFQGVASDPSLADVPLLILDVGGGSTEFIAGRAGHVQFRQSHRLGTVRWLEQFPLSDPPTPTQRARCRRELAQFLARTVAPSLAPSLTAVRASPVPARASASDGAAAPRPRQLAVTLVGTGGTTSIMAALRWRLREFDRERIDATTFTRRGVEALFERLWSLPLAERRQLPGLPPERADVILFGVAILAATLEVFALPRLRCSTRGLRHAALLELATAHPPPAPEVASRGPRTDPVAAARREVLDAMERIEPEPEHVLHVARLALQLFDRLAPLHRLGAPERLLLEAAACLHDLGWTVALDDTAHHKESARLIRAQPWTQLDARAVELIAQIARYHRKAEPSLAHAPFAALNRADRRRVQCLAALLRLADGLDRPHRQQVHRIEVQLRAASIRLRLIGTGALGAELNGARSKAALAEAVFGRRIELVAAPERGTANGPRP